MAKGKRRRQPWSVGDVFAMPIMDGRFALGQVVGREPRALNSVTVALFDRVVSDAGEAETVTLTAAEAFSVLLTSPDLLDSGTWSVATNHPIAVLRGMLPYEELRDTGFVGAKIYGSAIVAEFVNAYFGLIPWDDWKDPNYLDGLLLSSEKKPAKVRLKTKAPRKQLWRGSKQ